MSSRRRLPTAAERQSRLDQFRPGHVGGRVASAQPIRRNGGTLRRVAVGAAEVPAAPLPPVPGSQWLMGNWPDPYADMPPSDPWYRFEHRPYQYISGTYYWDTQFANVPDSDLLILGAYYGPVTLHLHLPDTIPDGGDVVFQVLDSNEPPIPATPGDLAFWVRSEYVFPGPHTPGSVATLGPMNFEWWTPPLLAASSPERMQSWVNAWGGGEPYDHWPTLGVIEGLDGSMTPI